MIKAKITLSEGELEDYLLKGVKVELEICDENGKIVDKINLLKQMNNEDDITNNERTDSSDDSDNNENNDGDKEDSDNNVESNSRKRKRNVNKIDYTVKSSSNNRKRRKSNKRKEIRSENERIGRLIEELSTPGNEHGETIVEDESDEEINDIRNLVQQYQEIEDDNRKSIWNWYHFGQKLERKINEMKNQHKGRRKGLDTKVREKLYDEMMRYLVIGDENVKFIKKKRESLRKRAQRATGLYEMFIKIGCEKINRIKDTCVSTITTLTDGERDQIIKYFYNRR
jgi:hypothetical protein